MTTENKEIPEWIRTIAVAPTNTACLSATPKGACGKPVTGLNRKTLPENGYVWVCDDHYQVPSIPKYGH